MSVRVVCACGHRLNVAETRAGGKVRCRVWRKPGGIHGGPGLSRPPLSPLPPPRPRANPLVWVLIGVGAIVPLVIATLLVVVVRHRPPTPYEVAPRETTEEKYRSAAETYRAGDSGSIEPGSDEARV